MCLTGKLTRVLYRVELPSNLRVERHVIPEGDLAHIKYENEGHFALGTIVLFSTPRSGSTLLSSEIDTLDGGPMAEYCQPFQVIPYLMSVRPQIATGGQLDRQAYAKYLTHLRSGSSQKLCIKVHASHVSIYKSIRAYLPKVERQYLLLRRNIIAQAVSYYIASQTGRWSSSYKRTNRIVRFDAAGITRCLLAIIKGVQKNLETCSMSSQVIIYENYLYGNQSFANMNGLKCSADEKVVTKKQRTNINDAFENKYIDLIQSRNYANVLRLIRSYTTLVGRFDAS